MGKFFIKKHCIYLDQFAVSNLAEQQDWVEILSLLKQGINNQRIIIPYSIEHLFESSKKEFEKAKVVDSLLFELSGGLTLKSAPQLVPLLLICNIRKRAINANTYTNKILESILSNPEKYTELKKRKEGFDQMAYEGALYNNQIREITRTGKKLTPTQHFDLRKMQLSNAENDLKNRLRKYCRYGFYDKVQVKFSMATIPYWADNVMDTLIYKYSITKEEAKKCEYLLSKNGLKTIAPPVYVRTVLESMLAIKHQKETHNDHFDILRLSSAIPFSDIIMTDKSKTYDIKTSHLDKDYNVEVYSGSKDDLNLFKSKIQSIIT